MNIVTLDFETYYSKRYSLGKLTTEEYVRHPQFEVIGVSVKVDAGTTVWCSGSRQQIQKFLGQFDWDNAVAVAHNARFDMAILNWHFDIKPKRIIDTLSMARALHGGQVGGSLMALVAYYNLGAKGTEVIAALGKRRADFTEEELTAYGKYCVNDTELTYGLCKRLIKKFPINELRLIDLTIRMFTEPVLKLDAGALAAHLDNTIQHKSKLLSKISVTKEDLMSNPKFAEALRTAGVVPPTKISARTGEEAWAFAKADKNFMALLQHETPEVQTLMAARLGLKSTLEETRTQRFIDMSEREGSFPVPLRYYAAHTGRWGGDDKINLQNLPRNAEIKKCILAPAGYVLIDSDSSQIEARTLAWLAEQYDLVDAFERGDDVYKMMAAALYGKAEEEITKQERFVGKTTILGCLAAGSQVLCERGWVSIELVTTKDRIWDGENWVCHQGLLTKGLKQTLNLCGLKLTPDHQILCGTKWLEAQSVVADENTLSQALGTAAGTLPLHAATTLKTNVKFKTSKKLLPTYDLAYAGPNNRYTVLTNRGPVLVHNCGYGMGADRFQAQLNTFGVEFSNVECKRIIDIYRHTYPRIPKLWRRAGYFILPAIQNNQATEFGTLTVEGQRGIRLPNNLYLKYPHLHLETLNPGERPQFMYTQKRGRSTVRTKIYGGKVVENVCQALARIIIGEQMLLVAKKYKVAMTVHDAVTCVVPEEEQEEAVTYIEKCMRTAPEWASGLPLNCETGVGLSYGGCK